jgi:hypothetical protein
MEAVRKVTCTSYVSLDYLKFQGESRIPLLCEFAVEALFNMRLAI